MKTEHIKEFVVLAETKNFWEASERLYMNQSTLSKHMKALEEELGVELFSRTTRHVELTDYGRTFLPYAQTMARQEFEGIAAVRRQMHIKQGLLNIGVIPSMPQYQITQLLAQFQLLYPGTSFRITEDDSADLMKDLMNESCEVIFQREDQRDFEKNMGNDPRVQRIPYRSDFMVALMQISHPLAGAESVTLKQLSQEQFCLIKEGTLLYQMSLDACQNAGFIPNIIYSSHRIDSILDMVAKQNCVALLMDQHMLFGQQQPDRQKAPWVAIPIQPEIRSQISLCYRKDRALSETAQRFIDFCVSNPLK